MRRTRPSVRGCLGSQFLEHEAESSLMATLTRSTDRDCRRRRIPNNVRMRKRPRRLGWQKPRRVQERRSYHQLAAFVTSDAKNPVLTRETSAPLFVMPLLEGHRHA